MATFSQHSVTKIVFTLLALFISTTTIMADSYAEGFNDITGTEDNLYSVPEEWDVIGSIRNFNLFRFALKAWQRISVTHIRMNEMPLTGNGAAVSISEAVNAVRISVI
jgi:hypothetical protein